MQANPDAQIVAVDSRLINRLITMVTLHDPAFNVLLRRQFEGENRRFVDYDIQRVVEFACAEFGIDYRTGLPNSERRRPTAPMPAKVVRRKGNKPLESYEEYGLIVTQTTL